MIFETFDQREEETWPDRQKEDHPHLMKISSSSGLTIETLTYVSGGLVMLKLRMFEPENYLDGNGIGNGCSKGNGC